MTNDSPRVENTAEGNAPSLPRPPDTASVAERLIGGRFELETEAIRGGVASVHRAVDRVTRRTVAVKFLSPDMASEEVEREIRLHGEVDHPHLLRSVGHGTASGLRFVVFPWLAGGSVLSWLGEGTVACRSPSTIARWLSPIASALDHLHGMGLVHGDVKPGNVLFDDEGQPRLTDFTVAAPIGSTSAGIRGTPVFLPPEALVPDAKVAVSRDVYALGATVYATLAGRAPRPSRSDAGIAEQIRDLSRLDPDPLPSGVPPPVAAVVMQALARSPEDRWLTCGSFADAFAVAANGARGGTSESPGVSCPFPLPARRTLSRRFRLALAAVAAAALAAAAWWVFV